MVFITNDSERTFHRTQGAADNLVVLVVLAKDLLAAPSVAIDDFEGTLCVVRG